MEVFILMNRRYPRIGGRGILPALLVYVWKVSDSTVDSAVAILFCRNVCEGVLNLENMHRSCLEGEAASLSCLSATENISGSFAAPRKTVKTIKQRRPTRVWLGDLPQGVSLPPDCVYIGRNMIRSGIPW